MNIATALADARGRPWLATLDPRLKIAVLVWFSLLGILLETVAALAALLTLAVVAATGVRMRPRGWVVVVGLLALVAWSTVVSQALFYPDERAVPLWTIIPPLRLAGWSFPGLHFYEEGAIYGLGQSLRMLSVTLVGLTICLSTSPERLLAALAHLRVPVSVSFLTVTTLRFLPLLVSQWALLRQARRLRGYRLRWWHLASPRAGELLHAEIALLVPLIASSVRRAAALSASVSSRGFDPLARRTFYPELRFRASERLMLAVLACTLMLIVLVKSIYWLHVTGWYTNSQLTPWSNLIRNWL
jgi:energy-coupling factor transport system permease protein